MKLEVIGPYFTMFRTRFVFVPVQVIQSTSNYLELNYPVCGLTVVGHNLVQITVKGKDLLYSICIQ